MSPTEPTPATTSDPSVTSDPSGTSGGPDARPCAGCGAANHPDRLLCGSCGVDLDDPSASVAGATSTGRVWSAAPDGTGYATGRSARGLALALLAVVAAVAVVLGVLVVTEVGPFTRAVDVPEAAFDAAAYPQDPQVLALSDVATLTTRTGQGGRDFTPTQLVDGETTTSWHGEVADLPAGLEEKVDLVLGQPAWITAVIIDNGDQATPDDYADAGRVQRARLVFDGDVVVPVTLLDQGLESQIVELDEPLLTTAIRIEILETVPGTERNDPALSGVELRGHPAVDDDLVLADERAAIRPAAGPIVEPA